MKKILLLLLVLVLGGGRHADAQERMPIIAYWGVPEWRTTDEDFRLFSECGFTVSLYPYTSLDKLVAACRRADKHGVKVLGQCPEITSAPARAATVLKGESGFYGYFILDEPSVPEIRRQQLTMEQLKRIDSAHPFYINLLPCYDTNPDWLYPMAKVRSYEEYLRAASATACQQLSFDYYPVLDTGLRNTWFHNLEMVRRESIASGKPFWGFVLSVPHVAYPAPTMATLRLQAYANLAYGAQAIQYFTYWTPDPNKDYNFHDAPMSPQGRKTKTYTLVQQMNRELKTVAQLFYGASVTDVHHLGVVSQGATRLSATPRNISSLKVESRRGAIVSQIEKDRRQYLAIVNKDYRKKMKVTIRSANGIPRHMTKTLQEEPMKETYTVPAGDILLFRLT